MATPLTPLSANTSKLPTSTSSSFMSSYSRSDSPSRLPQKTPKSASPTKLNQTSSPFSTSYSPVSYRGGFRTDSPSKMTDIDGDVDMDEGDESILSNFSDVTVSHYGTASQGLDRFDEASGTPKKSPVKSRPQTPISRQPVSTATTPRIAQPLSRSNIRSPGSDDHSSVSSPRTPGRHDDNQTTNLLLDFTTQFEAIGRPPSQPSGRQTPTHRRTKSSPNKGSPTKCPLPPSTPTESRFFNLLDFSPGPVASPRSIPSITPRELDDIKAQFQSQISQLRAELNGREVEVSGLHDAVRESEARSADMSTAMKDQQSRFEVERNSWQKVKTEMGQLFESEKAEKESLASILSEKEHVVDNLHQTIDTVRAELVSLRKRVQESEDDAARARDEVVKLREEAATAAQKPAAMASAGSNVQAEVERVARELHQLYKAKHENKVAALKKSYEGRWEKKVTNLQAEVATLTRKNEELQKEVEEKKAEDFTGDVSFSAATPASTMETEKLKMEVQQLKDELELERVEKSELISSVEELLALQAATIPDGVEDRMRGSIGRASGVGLGGHMKNANGSLRNGIERMGMGGMRDRPAS